MKKVLLVFDGEHYSDGVFECVKQMNAHQPVLAVGVFLPPIDYIELLYSFGGVPAGPLYINDVIAANDEIIKKNMDFFREQCLQNGIEYRLHTDTTRHVINQLKDETLFADLLVLGSKSFYENTGADTQEDYIINVSHKAECPVLMVPEKCEEPKNIIFAYDGSEQSVFAIKQFSYLFPYYSKLKALLIFFTDKNKEIPGCKELEELITCYYEDLVIKKIDLAHKKDMADWMLANGNPLLVAGAFGRSILSEFFKKSFTLDIIRHHELPVFIAHK